MRARDEPAVSASAQGLVPSEAGFRRGIRALAVAGGLLRRTTLTSSRGEKRAWCIWPSWSWSLRPASRGSTSSSDANGSRSRRPTVSGQVSSGSRCIPIRAPRRPSGAVSAPLVRRKRSGALRVAASIRPGAPRRSVGSSNAAGSSPSGLPLAGPQPRAVRPRLALRPLAERERDRSLAGRLRPAGRPHVTVRLDSNSARLGCRRRTRSRRQGGISNRGVWPRSRPPGSRWHRPPLVAAPQPHRLASSTWSPRRVP